jgi:hypothetical protein
VRNFACGTCGSLVFFENSLCSSCGSELGFETDLRTMVVVRDSAAEIEGHTWLRCANAFWGCNWLVRDDAGSGFCVSCRLTRTRPANDDTIALEQLQLAGYPKRRLMFQILEQGIPYVPYYETAGVGLAFDLLSTASGERVMTGHLDGVITLDLEEVDDPYREQLRVAFNEPYRTMLGHFRHEIGHYYWQFLVSGSDRIDDFRSVFGDERASYQDAIDRHYRDGAPDGWHRDFVSEYATMHPWEDFAEVFAHYLHITDTLQTAAATGLLIDGSATISGLDDDLERPRLDYTDAGIGEILRVWHAFTVAFNEINRSMGMRDVYPFTLSPAVDSKLAWVHELVADAVRRARP